MVEEGAVFLLFDSVWYVSVVGFVCECMCVYVCVCLKGRNDMQGLYS